MKRILAILASVSVGVSAAASVIACGIFYKNNSLEPKNISNIKISEPEDGESLEDWKQRIIKEINNQLSGGTVEVDDLEFEDNTNGFTNSGKIVIKGKDDSLIDGSINFEFVVKPSKPLNEITITPPDDDQSWDEWVDSIVIEINSQLGETKITKDDLVFTDETDHLNKPGTITVKGKKADWLKGTKIIDAVVRLTKTLDELTITPPDDDQSWDEWIDSVVAESNQQLRRNKIKRTDLEIVDNTNQLYKSGTIVFTGKDPNWLKGSKTIDVVARLTKTLDELTISQPTEEQTITEWTNSVINEINQQLGRIKISEADLVITDETNGLNHSGNIYLKGANPDWLKGTKTISIFVKADKGLSEVVIPKPKDDESFEAWKERVISEINRQLGKGKVSPDDLEFEDNTNEFMNSGTIVIKTKPGSVIEGVTEIDFAVKPDKPLTDITITPPDDDQSWDEWVDSILIEINNQLGEGKIVRDDLDFEDNTFKLMKSGTVVVKGKDPTWLKGWKTIDVVARLTKTLDEMTISQPTENQNWTQWINSVVSELNEQLGRVKITKSDLLEVDGTRALTQSGDVTFKGADPNWLKGSKTISIIIQTSEIE